MRDYADKRYLRRQPSDNQKALIHAAWAGPLLYLILAIVLA